jgi:hypothetical protein
LHAATAGVWISDSLHCKCKFDRRYCNERRTERRQPAQCQTPSVPQIWVAKRCRRSPHEPLRRQDQPARQKLPGTERISIDEREIEETLLRLAARAGRTSTRWPREFIRSEGIARCPTVCLAPTQGLVAAGDRAALRRRAAGLTNVDHAPTSEGRSRISVGPWVCKANHRCVPTNLIDPSQWAKRLGLIELDIRSAGEFGPNRATEPR